MCLLCLSDDPLKRCFTSHDSDPYFTRVSGPLIVLSNPDPLPVALLQVETCFGLCLFSKLLSAASPWEKWQMHVRNHLSEQQQQNPLLKNAKFLLRGWTQTKLLFRKMEKIFRLEHDRDAHSPANAGAAGIKPGILHLSGIWWLPLSVGCWGSWSSGGQTEGWKQDLCHRNHRYAFKYKHVGSSVIVRLLHLEAPKRLLWLDVASLNLNVLVSEQPPRLFLSLLFWTKRWTFSDRFCSSEGKTWRTSPLSLLHGVALLTVVQIFSMTYSCTSAMLNKAWYRSTSSFKKT